MLYAVKTEGPYQAYIDTLSEIDLKQMKESLNSREKKLAFWINIYNALVQIKLSENPASFQKKGISSTSVIT